MKQIILFRTIVLIVALAIQTSEAVRNVYKPADCNSCLAQPTKYSGICKSKYSEVISYCCTPDEMNNHRACYESPMCSSRISSIDMRPMMCPHDRSRCGGISSPTINLKDGESKRIKINKSQLFNELDVCHFQLTTDDMLKSKDIDPKNRKYLNLYFDYFEGVDVYISNSTRFEDIQYRSIVGYTNRNFTQPNTQNYYVVVKPKFGSSWGDYKLDFTMRFYTYDPGCPEFTSWDGFKCQANYTSYCQALTPMYVKQTGDNTTTVSFNGTACVVNPGNGAGSQSDTKTGAVGSTVGGKDGETGPKTMIPVIEMSQKRTREAELKKAGTDQIAHTVALVFIIIGVFIYILVDFRTKNEIQAPKDPKDMMVKQNDENLMVPKINYENLETEVGMSEAQLNEGKTKDPDDVDGDALTNNTPRGQNSSRRESMASQNQNDEYMGYNALKHHLHFESHSPNKNKKKGFLNASSALGMTFKKKSKIQFEMTPELMGENMSHEEIEKTKTNLLLKEQIERQHGTIIQDDSVRVNEGAATLDDAEIQLSDRSGSKKVIDFHSNYKYLPKDGSSSLAAAASFNPQASIEEEEEDEEVHEMQPQNRKNNKEISINDVSESQDSRVEALLNFAGKQNVDSTLSEQRKEAQSSSSKHPDSDISIDKSAQPLISGKKGQDHDSDFSMSVRGPDGQQLSPKAAARAEIQKQMEINKSKAAQFVHKGTKKSKEAELLEKIRSLKQEWAEDEDDL